MNRIGPGMLLAGRYRLEEQVAADPLTATWRARDLILDRTVAVRVLAPTHSRVQATLDAARRAVLADDPRLQRVLGVGTEVGSGFVVLEWIDGRPVAELAGVVDEDEAVRIAREVTEGLLAASRRQLHHGHLGPETVLRAPDDRIRITGLAIDAAAAGGGSEEDAAEEEARDVRDVGALLYALLTSCWPFGYRGGLLAAPTERGRPVPPTSLVPGTSPEAGRLAHQVVQGEGPQGLGQLLQALAAIDGSVAEVPAAPGPGASSDEVAGAGSGDAADDAAAGGAAGGTEGDAEEPTPPAARPTTAADGTETAPGAARTGAGATAAAGAAGVAGAAAAAGAAAGGPAAGAPTPGAAPADPVGTVGRPRSAYAPAGGTAASPATDDGWSLLPVDDPYAQQHDTYDTYDEVDPGYQDAGYGEAAYADSRPSAAGYGAAAPLLPAGAGRAERGRGASGAGTGVAVVLVVAAFVVSGLVWALDRVTADVPSADPPPVVAEEPAPEPEPEPEPSAPPPEAEPEPEPELRLITPAGAQALDPQGDGAENDQEAPRAIDNDPATFWSTERYDTQDFGGLKEGVGLVLDLGAPETVTGVQVLATGAGGSYEVRTASNPSLEGTAVIGTGATGPDLATIAPEAPVQTQYLVVWFTALPDNGEWRGQLNEVQVQVQ